MAETKPPCYCGRNDETGYMELCPEHEGEMFDHMMDTDRISALQAQLAARDRQIARLREALEAVQWGDERYCDDLDRPESGVLYRHCPDCGNSEDDGRHAEGCIIRIALADTPAGEPDPRDQQIARLRQELSHLVRLLEPLERDGGLNVPGLATLNGARAALAEVPEPTGATLAADRVTTGTIIATTDTERLNKLEALARSGSVGNGIALFPITYIHDGSPSLQLQELGDEDGTDLGDVVAQGRTLREAIDALSEPTKELSEDDRMAKRLRDANYIFGVWRCSSCGDMIDPNDARSRWNGTIWEHKCGGPQSGHEPCRYFGPAEPTKEGE